MPTKVWHFQQNKGGLHENYLGIQLAPNDSKPGCLNKLELLQKEPKNWRYFCRQNQEDQLTNWLIVIVWLIYIRNNEPRTDAWHRVFIMQLTVTVTVKWRQRQWAGALLISSRRQDGVWLWIHRSIDYCFIWEILSINCNREHIHSKQHRIASTSLHRTSC
jgi:hypothetical protein